MSEVVNDDERQLNQNEEGGQLAENINDFEE
jgi:hypothetical protein